MKFSSVVVCALALGLAGCDAGNGGAAGPDGISAEDLARHVEILASDEFEGRGPSSPGEEKTVAYLAEQFRAMGLQPGNGDSYFQEVPLVDITADPDTTLTFTDAGGNQMRYAYASEMVVGTTRVVEHSAVDNSEVVFVGYGIVAPEYDWDDYAGLDVTGKTVIILVNDPGFVTGDNALFTGKAMTYYGRWTYKYEEAARQGAAAALIIHQTEPAAYGWDTVRNSWTGPQFNLEAENGNMDRIAIEGWITEQTARALFEQTGVDFDAVTAGAAQRGFTPRHLGRTASVAVNNTIRHSLSKNVVALLPGSEVPDEYFVYMAHWDHLGIDRTIEGDGIYNGALDNASGTAALLELAQAYATLDESPRRSMVFLAVTAEEQGLLGSAHYAANPLFPLNKTVAGLNMDGLNVIGATREITVTGYGMSELDGVLQQAADARGRRVDADPQPEHGYYYRSDHFELAKLGVPMIYPKRGMDHIEKGVAYGLARSAQYRAERYHMPTDEFDDTWDLSGAVEDVLLYYDVGLAVANSTDWPNWYENVQFRSIRDASMAVADKVVANYDVIIRGGTIYDGNGGTPYVGDVAITGDRIVALGDLGNATGRSEIDAAGKAVSPGFINMLSWATESLIWDGRGMSDIKQGVTLEVMGEGWSMGPLTEEMKTQQRALQGDIKFDIEWTTLGEYMDYLTAKGISPNVASYVGATTIRIHELDRDDIDPTPEQLARMQDLVREAMREGALGVGSSLIYAPAFYAETPELIALVSAAAEFDGAYISHVRSEAGKLEEAIGELIEISRTTGAPAEIYHLKASGKPNWPKLEKAFALVEAARAEGLRVTANMYTYPASATGLSAAMPLWVQEGGHEKWMARMREPEVRTRLVREMKEPSEDWNNRYLDVGPEGILLLSFKNPKLKPLTGMTLQQVADARGMDPAEVAVDLIVEDDSRVGVSYFSMSEENVKKKVAQPWVSFGSDEAAPANEGVFLLSNNHPRAYGTFARVLGKYSRDEGIIPLEEAIRKLTSLPAYNIGIRDRGQLATGYYADVVVFDPATVADNATFPKPHQYATGIEHVFVNGGHVLADGEHTGALPGRVVRGPGWTGWTE